VGIRRVAADELGGDAAIRRRFADEGLRPRSWTSEPGSDFGWHSHPQAKVLYCVRGSITFQTEEIHCSLSPGDRLEIEADTEHSAKVGPDRVECLEAFR
jgi:quercetin dioxygenase-like cupin family protein